jgi:hypothetical protein
VHRVSASAGQEAFFEGHVHAFNVALVAGVSARHLGLDRSRGRALIALGVLGLTGFVLFMVDVRAGIEWNIGLLERWAIYPIMVGHALLGATMLTRQAARVIDAHEGAALAR